MPLTARQKARAWSRFCDCPPVKWTLMALAEWWDRTHPRTCRASTITDLGLGYDLVGFRDNALDGDKPRSGCIEDARRDGTCYCGKYHANRYGDVVLIHEIMSAHEERDLFTEAP